MQHDSADTCKASIFLLISLVSLDHQFQSKKFAGMASSPLKRPPVGRPQLQASAIASPNMSEFLRLL